MLKIYNTLTRKKEPFYPLYPNYVGIYVCGPTVYSHSHLGHAKSYITFDVIVRYLRWLGYRVKYVQNITDVGHLLDTGEDRIVKGAKQEKLTPMEIVEKYTQSYLEDMKALNVLHPNIQPRATGHILEQIEMIEKLIEKGYAYQVGRSVYFDVSKFKDYGKLSRRKIEDQTPGARIEVSKDKKHPYDFLLWREAAEGHLMQWKSPWGRGYPGWHIECSTMAIKYLGETLDIHGGGIENIFPHHECEIAQSESLTGKEFVRYWVHNNMIKVNGVKMSKSLGNVVTIKDALKKYSPESIRFFILSTHYRKPLNFTEEALKGAEEGVKKIYSTYRRLKEKIKIYKESKKTEKEVEMVKSYYQKFLQNMDDDFNTPQGIGVMFDLSRELNKYLDKGGNNLAIIEEGIKFYEEFGIKILGIIKEKITSSTDADKLVDLIVTIRTKLRTLKNWELADEIREKLNKLGVLIEDGKQKTNWHWKI
jgi:cysteinyl-tRNA synthetase